MLRSIVTFCLRFRLVVLLLAASLMVGGSVVLRDAPWDVFPDFAPPQNTIQTEAPGLSTEEVERLVTIPVESALGGVTRLKTLRSSSVPGLSVVTAIFEDGTDVLSARQLVGERLAEIGPMLPEGVEPPRMTPLTAATARLLMIGLTSDTTSLMDLRTLADWTFQRRLQAVPGVAKVEVFGGQIKQYQVLVHPQRLQQYNVTLDDVLAAARRATGFGGAGFVETANQRLSIRQRTRIESPADLGAVPVVYQDGLAITLADVAEVRVGAADMVGEATIDGKPGVLLVVQKQPFFNTLRVTQAVETAVEELRASLPPGVQLNDTLFRQATFIEHTLRNLSWAIVFGCALVAAVLIAFLHQWRTAAISLAAIPLSLLGAVVILRCFGASLDTMTLGGLAISIGVVVDDAIVDVENIVRRMRENRRLPQPRALSRVILDASLEVRSAVVYASFIVILVFLPVLFLKGLAGTFFRPLGVAYIIAILISLLVAVTVIPAMCLVLLRGGQSGEAVEPALVRVLKNIYRKLLPPLLNRPWTTTLVAAVLLAASVAVIPLLGGEFLPDFRESNFVVFMAGKPDSSLAESRRVGAQLAKRLKEIPGIHSVAQQTGRADLSEDTWGPNVSEVWIAVDEGGQYEQVLRGIRDKLVDLPGYVFSTKQFLRERMDEVLTGATADVVIRVVGPDLAVLRALAGKIEETIRPIEGVADLRVEQQVDVPEIEVVLRPQDAAGYGLSVGELHQEIQTLLRGTRAGQVYEPEAVFDLVLRAHPEVRSDPIALGRILIDTPNQEKVPLRAVATVGIEEAPNIINREGGSRRILVTCNVAGRDVSGVMRDIQQQIHLGVALPPSGYHLEFGGEYEARKDAQQRLWLLGSVALVGIFVLLYLDFQTVRLTAMVMLSVPLACVGGVAAVLLAGGDVSLGSMVGFVTVFGVAVRNGILLISHYQHLATVEGVPFGRELIVRGALERLTPILMTAAATALTLLPLIVLGDRPGYEIEHPMAVVIVGGLISSTLLSLGLLPVLYQWFGMMNDG
jgi:CzcA family heavy metal efflux pump